MTESRLHEVSQLGQSIWYDNIRRGLITSGDLQRLIDEDAVVGVTSNPTIFEKAIDGSGDYDDQLKELVGPGVTDRPADFRRARHPRYPGGGRPLQPNLRPQQRQRRLHQPRGLPQLRPTTRRSHHRRGAEPHKRVDRPNMMIKIPATSRVCPRLKQMIYEGVNINITLIFALDRLSRAWPRRTSVGWSFACARGCRSRDIASVASFFVSRVDTMMDKQLDEKIAQESDPDRAAGAARPPG